MCVRHDQNNEISRCFWAQLWVYWHGAPHVNLAIGKGIDWCFAASVAMPSSGGGKLATGRPVWVRQNGYSVGHTLPIHAGTKFSTHRSGTQQYDILIFHHGISAGSSLFSA